MASPKFEFTHKKKDADGNETQAVASSEGSVSFKSFVDKLLDSTKDNKLNWKKRDLLKPHKLQLLALVPHIVNELSNSISNDSDAYEQTLDFLSKRDGLS